MSNPTGREIDLAIGGAAEKGRAVCHLMPCLIEHNQMDVKAREYFWPTIRELKAGGDDEQGRSTKHDKSIHADKEPILLASLRGRPLQGKRIDVPAGYVGHVVNKEPTQPATTPTGGFAGGAQKGPRIKKHFREFTYWHWDQLPDKDDTVVKALRWLQVAKSIHDPAE